MQFFMPFLFSFFFYTKGGSNKCRGLPDCVATGHGVCGLQHRWVFCCQRVNHGQWPQGPPRSCRCCQVSDMHACGEGSEIDPYACAHSREKFKHVLTMIMWLLLIRMNNFKAFNVFDVMFLHTGIGRTWDIWLSTSPADLTCRSSAWYRGSRSTIFPMGWSSSLKAWFTIPYDKRPSSSGTSYRRYYLWRQSDVDS